MAKTDAERKRAERERKKERDRLLGMANMTLRMSQGERKLVARRAVANGYEDQTEYLLSLVYADLEKPADVVCNYPDCSCPFDMGPDGKCLRGKPREQKALSDE